ncbi:Rpn family recombination-promoting nuclease/putative transposase [Frisingicoccus sp.]|uniref:Rpn family recombination-promoting nuclease/putative transposase n=1 Tax=Frisingicoccus sp. TaxID=1918627 RepID=UPI003AB7B0C6
MAHKKFKDLDLKNAFLFSAAMSDAEICKMIIEIVLGQEITNVKVHVEHSLLFSSDFRSIRLDVYAADELQIGYNLEMQNKDKRKLPKRSRYHQAEMDVMALKPGENFEMLRPGYVIFICTFDPFEHKLYRYTFEERCLERNFPLGDETKKIFLSTKGENDNEVSSELVNFLHYVENSSDEYVEHVKDGKVSALHQKIMELKKNREWEERYMTFEELLKDSEREGEIKGQERLLSLINEMAGTEDAEKISKLGQDSALLCEMLEKYHL